MANVISAGIAAAVRSRLRCPTCRASPLSIQSEDYACTTCGARYLVAQGRPILFRSDNDIFNASDYLQPLQPPARPRLARLVPDLSINLSRDQAIAKLARLLSADAAVLVVGAGTQREWLVSKLGGSERTIVCCDVDVRATVDLFCDGHDLPFADDCFDAVITTAVLEHVLYPERVASEIARVARLGALLYSELPFMQQVHEGAYDFTRYTLSGHRRLFNQFEEVEAGMVAGPGTTLAWALEGFVLAFVRGRRRRTFAKAASRFGFGALKYFDRLLKDRPEAMDGASCTYLLGRLAAHPISDIEIIRSYLGAKPLTHI